MKLTHYIFIGAAFAMLTACGDEVNVPQLQPVYTVGEAVNAITLSAGISEGGSGVQTRAVDVNHAGSTNGGAHTNFTAETKLSLRVDGTWLGHGTTPYTVSKTTTASIGGKTGADNKHNEVSFSTTSIPVEQLYWDDYGTADPANMPDVTDNGREKGLTIYGAAVDGVTTAPTITSWTSQTWSIGTPTSGIIDQTNGWSTVDLLTSNNITSTADGNYKFDDYIKKLKGESVTPSDILVFTHAMTKITVNLTAGEGFPGYTTISPENAKFETDPKVTLLGFNYKGTVSVEEKTSTPTENTTMNIEMHLASGGKNNNKATLDALVFPGNTFSANIGDAPEYKPTSSTEILKLNADGNIYKVTAAQLVKAIAGTTTPGSVDGTLLQGKNYILNIIVNKTEIKVTATVKNWEDVEAAEEAPIINVNTSYSSADGMVPDGFKSFSFYRSASDPFASTPVDNKLMTYSNSASLIENNCYKPEEVPTGSANQKTKWTFTNTLYWPSHNTHYHFRGIWPTTVATKDESYNWENPRVKMNTANSAQVIALKNVKYESGKFPSDLLIGAPEFTDENKNCTNEDHDHVDQSQFGICATEGLITLNFKYIMSQVEVELKTTAAEQADHVNINENTTVEIVNVANEGNVQIGDRTVVVSSQAESYTLDKVSGVGNELKRHSAIVPQNLTYSTPGATGNVRFKITVTNNDAVSYADAAEYNAAKGTSLDDTAFAALSPDDKIKTPATTDIYYADINPIKEKDKTTKVAPNGKWESGVHYKYVLTLSKTEIKITATLTDWVTLEADEPVWL